MSADIYQALSESASIWLKEAARFSAAKESAYKVIRLAHENGVAETTLAQMFKLDRGTIRTIVGKPRPK